MNESEHIWFKEQIATYLAEGLRGQELARFESHASSCAACAEELSAARLLEQQTTELFAAARPAADFEDRLIRGLRFSAGVRRRWIHPLVKKASIAAAAAIVLGGLGFAGSEFLKHADHLNLAAANLHQIGRSLHIYADDDSSQALRAEAPYASGLDEQRSRQEHGYLKYSFETAIADAKHAIASNDIAPAQTALERAKVARRANPGVFHGDELDQFDSAIDQTQAALDRAREKSHSQQGERSRAEQQPVTAAARAQTVADLARESRRLTEDGQYAQALGVLDQILKIDPHNDYAQGARPLIEDRAIMVEQRQYRERYDHSLVKQYNASEEQKPPLSDVLTFPSSWPGLSRDGKNAVQYFRPAEEAQKPRQGQAQGTNSYALGTTVQNMDGSNSPAPRTAGAPATQPTGAAPASSAIIDSRKVIREGTMEFEVDSFDSAFNTISKITEEEGGFIAAADSDKLPNGKVRGCVTVRVPPQNLDTLVLKLRALGDLKSQRLGSRDISKEYTDLQSELRAAKAMEERLLEMIKNAQGKVKDLLEAEKELGNWREKIEKIQGQINYYNNLVSMATLTINAYEKDIKTPASASQTEQINAGLETDDVENARSEAIKSIDQAKGRIIESTLQQLEAGQLVAKIVAEVTPEQSGPIVDRLRQLGRIARLDIQRKQTDEKAQGTGSLGVKTIETAPTRLIISMYNLANVAPRLTTNVNLAGDDVETVYHAILTRVVKANGRVLSSSMNRKDATSATASIQFEVKSSEADAVLNDVRNAGQVLQMSVTENPDTANVTTAKQAFTVQIIPASQVAPRETRTLSVQTADVERAMQTLSSAASSAGGRVIDSSLSQDPNGKQLARLVVEVPLSKADQLVDAARASGTVRTAESTKNTQVPEGPLARARLNLTIGSGEGIVSAEHGFWASIREGLSTSVRGLLWSLELIVIGLCLVGPWVLLIWGGWKFARRRRATAG